MPIPWLVALLFAGGASYLWWKQQQPPALPPAGGAGTSYQPPPTYTPPGNYGVKLNLPPPNYGPPPGYSGPIYGATSYGLQNVLAYGAGNGPDPTIAAGAQAALASIPPNKQYPVITGILQALIATPTPNQLQAAIASLNATPSNQGPSAVAEAQAVASQLAAIQGSTSLGGGYVQPPGVPVNMGYP